MFGLELFYFIIKKSLCQSKSEHDLKAHIGHGNALGYGDYVVRNSKCINVLLVGRSQTGKSTIVQTLIDPQSGTSSTGFSDTREPLFESLILTNKVTNESYQLNIIDTPGLKEVRRDEESRTDDELLKLISKCVEERITSLNIVCFVSKAGTTHRLDTEAFQKVMEFLGDKYSKISMMVLTHCDEYDDEDLNKFEQDIHEHDVSKPFSKYCQLGIAKYGAIDISKLKVHKQHARQAIVQDKLGRLQEMRNNFLGKVTSCADKEMKVAELQQIYEETRKSFKDEVEKHIWLRMLGGKYADKHTNRCPIL